MSYIWEFFFHSKNCLKDTTVLSKFSVFQTGFWVKKEFSNVTHKLISPPQAKKFSAKIRSLRQVFETKRKRSLRQENWLFIYKKNGKIIVSVTVNSVASLQRNMSQWQTFGEMKLKIKKTKKKKTISIVFLFLKWLTLLRANLLNFDTLSSCKIQEILLYKSPKTLSINIIIIILPLSA